MIEEHIVIRRFCRKCGSVKPASEFWKNAGKRSGFQSQCKSCHRLANNRAMQRNRLTPRQIAQAWFKQYYLGSTNGVERWGECGAVEGSDGIHKKLLKCRSVAQCESVIGNNSWSNLTCWECYDREEPHGLPLIELGDPEAKSVMVCSTCINKALGLFKLRKVKRQPVK